MAADEFRGGMDDNIGAMLDRPDQVRCTEGIVNHNGNPMPVCDFRNRVDVRDITVRIAQGFQEDRPGVIRNRRFHLFEIMNIHKGSADAVLGKRMPQQIKCAAVNSLLCYDMAAVCRKSLDCIRNRRRSRCYGQGCTAAFQGCKPFLKHFLGGICQPSIDVPRICQAKTVSGMFAVMEHIGSGLVNWHGPGIGRGIRLLLSNM